MAYATAEDVEARWRALSDDESERAEVLLDDAAAMLDALVDVDAEDDGQAALLKWASCSMVIRAMSAQASDLYGMSQVSYGMGPFSQTAQFSNPSGDLYISAQERKLLGIDSGYIVELRAKVGDTDA